MIKCFFFFFSNNFPHKLDNSDSSRYRYRILRMLYSEAQILISVQIDIKYFNSSIQLCHYMISIIKASHIGSSSPPLPTNTDDNLRSPTFAPASHKKKGFASKQFFISMCNYVQLQLYIPSCFSTSISHKTRST